MLEEEAPCDRLQPPRGRGQGEGAMLPQFIEKLQIDFLMA